MISRYEWDMRLTPEDLDLLKYDDQLEEPPREPVSESTRAINAGLEAAAQEALSMLQRSRTMSDTILDGTGEEPPGNRILDGSDLEIAYNRTGNNLVLRVNKGPVQIFRIMLLDAFKHFDDRKLFDFNSVSPDFVFKIGDVREGLLAMGRAAGFDADQMQKLETKARQIAHD